MDILLIDWITGAVYKSNSKQLQYLDSTIFNKKQGLSDTIKEILRLPKNRWKNIENIGLVKDWKTFLDEAKDNVRFSIIKLDKMGVQRYIN